MFQSARIKLTGFYLMIIMLISIIFSMAFYKVATLELEHGLNRLEHRIRLSPLYQELPPQVVEIREELEEAKRKVALQLFYINGAIILLAGGAGYFLAGKTLAPIEESMEEHKRFISDASHELRTPIAALKTTLEVSIRDKNIDNQSKSLFKELLFRVNGLHTLTNNLLRLTRNKSNGSTHFKKISLHPIINKTIKTIMPIARDKDIVITTKLDKKSLNVIGDKTTLTELFTILLDNAIKYSKKNDKITVTTKDIKKQVSIIVEDTGTGIDKKDLPYVFDRFYRADQARTKSTQDGHGLGLSVAKRIVIIHNGSICVESEKGQGTKVTFELPKTI